MSNNIYFGQARTVEKKWGSETQLRVHRDDVQALLDWLAATDQQWARINIKAKRTPTNEWDRYGQLDQWVPPEPTAPDEARDTERAAAARVDDQTPTYEDEEIPF